MLYLHVFLLNKLFKQLYKRPRARVLVVGVPGVLENVLLSVLWSIVFSDFRMFLPTVVS